MGEKHSKAARFSTAETIGERGVVKSTEPEVKKMEALKKEPKIKGGEEVVENLKQPSVSKRKPSKIRDEDEPVKIKETKPIMTEEERSKRKETIRRDDEKFDQKQEKEYREKRSKADLVEKYGDYGEGVQLRVDSIVDEVNESRSDFEDIMESYMNKLTNTKLLIDEIQKENVAGDVLQYRNNIEVCVIRSNFFIANVVQSILSQRETLVFQTPDPFFKVIPLYLWRKFEKHYDNLLLIQKRFPNSEESFRSIMRQSERTEFLKSRKSKYDVSKYDSLSEEFNLLVNYLEEITGMQTTGGSSEGVMERKFDRLIRLFSELENDSRKNYVHTKTAIKRLKTNISELTGIFEQAEDVYPEMPVGFKALATATRKGEKKRVELKKCSVELKSVCDALMEIRRDLSSLSTSAQGIDIKERGDLESRKGVYDVNWKNTSSRIQTIFWHLYVVKHLFVPELFSMDVDEMSFKKMKDIVKRLNFTSLFKNTYSQMDAKIVLVKYVLEVLLETDDLLERHIEESFGIERREEEGVMAEKYMTGSQYLRKESKGIRRTVDDSITKTQSNVNQMIELMNELEESFREIA